MGRINSWKMQMLFRVCMSARVHWLSQRSEPTLMSLRVLSSIGSAFFLWICAHANKQTSVWRQYVSWCVACDGVCTHSHESCTHVRDFFRRENCVPVGDIRDVQMAAPQGCLQGNSKQVNICMRTRYLWFHVYIL